ncbi:MAG: hypothetical protein LBT36_05145, partial [Oscillospiraceae bacterium]|nr:hypothetical protein [Oscillospiraceae bacterium]
MTNRKRRGKYLKYLAATLAILALTASLSSCALFGELSGDYYMQAYNANTKEYEGKSEYIKFGADFTFLFHTADQYGFVDVPGTYTRADGIATLVFTDPRP